MILATSLILVWGISAAASVAAAASDLRATVRLGSGLFHWQNSGSEELFITGYTLSSASGSLLPDQWQPITDRLDQDGDGSFDENGTWVIFSPTQPFPMTASDLSEGVLTGDGGWLAPGETISLGGAWDPLGSLDLSLRISTTLSALLFVDIYYLPAGDFNLDGVVDAADYTLWRNSLGQTGAGLLADANGDGIVDEADYLQWKADFGQTQFLAPGALHIAPLAASVPEPATLGGVAALAGGLCWRRRRRKCQRAPSRDR